MSSDARKKGRPEKLGRRCYVGEHVVPEVRWLEGMVCPKCGCAELMDAEGMALCVKCNRFVKPKKA